MAGYDDDFQGYAIGANVPFGSWILDPTAFEATIVSDAAGTGIPGTDRFIEIFLGAVAVDPAVTHYQTSFTQYSALKLLATLPFGGSNFAFANGPNGGGFTFTLLVIKVETDGTITAYDGNGNVLKNSKDVLFRFFTWNFLQQNVTLSDDEILGVKYVKIVYQLILNGTEAISVSVTTPTPVAGLTNGTAEVNRFQLLGGKHGAYTLQGLTAAGVYPHPGSPNAVLFQSAAEVNALVDDGEVQISMAAAEVNTLPDTALLEVIQSVIEVNLEAANKWYISES